MLSVHVFVRVRPDVVGAFRSATTEYARRSVQEKGVSRFEVLQQEADPTQFVLLGAFANQAAAALHKETAHYSHWRTAVAEMMAEPSRTVRYAYAFPDDASWR